MDGPLLCRVVDTGHRQAFEAAEVGRTGVWIASSPSLPAEVRQETASFDGEQPQAHATRGLADVVADLGAIVASGVVGNAAYDALPLTANYLHTRLRARAGRQIDHAQATEIVMRASRAAYGSSAGVRVRRAERTYDGSWDVT